MSEMNHASRSSVSATLRESPIDNMPPPWNVLFPLAIRIFVWGLFFAGLYLLSSFFLLIFLTFVFSYILSNGVNRLEPYIQSRTRRVVLFSVLFFGLLTSIILYLTPKVIEQAEHFATKFGVYTQRIDDEILGMARHYPLVGDLLKRYKDPEDTEGKLPSPTGLVLKQVVGLGGEDPATSQRESVRELLNNMKNIGAKVLSVVSAFLLSLLFSFLIVLDLPQLGASVRGLRDTRLRFIHDEVFDSIRNFGLVMGRAFEAQFTIAVLNTILTAIGLYFLGLGEHAAFLSVIVFLFSFVPVAGVFISSVPICLIALQVAGVKIMLAAIVLITIIHLIEGYILNPRIYGSHMRINPVIVLMILTIGGKLFQFWGLILGVPVCTYLFGHAITLNRQNGEDTETEETLG